MALDILLSWNQWIRKFLPCNCILWRWKIINFPAPSPFLLPLSKLEIHLTLPGEENSHHNSVPEKVLLVEAQPRPPKDTASLHHIIWSSDTAGIMALFLKFLLRSSRVSHGAELDSQQKKRTTENQTPQINCQGVHHLKYIFLAKHNLRIVRAYRLLGTAYKSHLLWSEPKTFRF